MTIVMIMAVVAMDGDDVDDNGEDDVCNHA